MNHFIHRMLGHYLMDAAEEGADLSGADGQAEHEEEDQDEGQEGEEGEGQDDDAEDDDGGMVVTIGDEAPAEEQDDKAAPAWVKDLRKAQRELQKENRELKAQIQQSTPKPKVQEVGKKPALTDDDIDYDPEKFEQALTAWHDRKRSAEQAAQQQEQEQKAQQEAWNGRLESYKTAKAALKVKDFEDAEEVTTSVFNEVQQALIIDAADNPALVIYALGKNPAKAKELAAITSHTKFLREISRLEDTKLKVQNRKAPPAPERTVSGTGKISGTTDSTLERLRAEAEKTGDMSKVVAYKRQIRDKKKG